MNYENFEYICDYCKNIIKGKKAYYIINHIKNHQVKSGFCSNKCRQQKLGSEKIKVECHQCKKIFQRRPKSIKSNYVFCDAHCRAIWHNEQRVEYCECLGCKKIFKKKKRKNPLFCNRECQQKYVYETYIKKWKNGESIGFKGKENVSIHIRKYLFLINDNKCSKCGWHEINSYTNKIPLQIDHIDGNWKNNKEENLQLLCPNCHSLTPTYGSLNKGNGREYRKNWRKGLVGIKNKNNL